MQWQSVCHYTQNSQAGTRLAEKARKRLIKDKAEEKSKALGIFR